MSELTPETLAEWEAQNETRVRTGEGGPFHYAGLSYEQTKSLLAAARRERELEEENSKLKYENRELRYFSAICVLEADVTAESIDRPTMDADLLKKMILRMQREIHKALNDPEKRRDRGSAIATVQMIVEMSRGKEPAEAEAQ